MAAASSSPKQPCRILFVCGKNLRRSPTAEALYCNDPRVQVRSAGVSEKSRRRVRASDLVWADLILVMERRHAARIREAFAESGGMESSDSESESAVSSLPPIISLEIPDEYEYMDAELVELLRQSVEHYLGQTGFSA
ncbi:MAG: protein tyrosine phosphatase [Candidatus Methylacidiphilales bacterium]|nr:hypothetical protein [Candidatus Methylacidiphilales bacterium]